MNKYALEKAILVGEVTTTRAARPPYHESGNCIVLEGVKTERDALRIVSALDDNGETMTLDSRKITGLLGTRGSRHIAPPGKDTDIAYNPAKQELHLYAGAVHESAINHRAGSKYGVHALVFGPYLKMASGVADLQGIKTRFDKVAGVMPYHTNWHDVRDGAVNDQFLAASVKAVDGIVSRSGLQGELTRVGNPDPAIAVLFTTGLAYLGRQKL